MPKVSVIIPVYNVESFLEECISSIISQTLEDIEIICVNDGSTDNSVKILKEYLEKDKRITIVEQSNGGLSCARNKGVEYASGDYIYFMDSDDFIEHEALECLFDRSTKDNLDILYFNAESFFEDKESELKCSVYKDYYKRNCSYPDVNKGSTVMSHMVSNRDWKPSAVLQFINKDFYRESGLSFYEGILHEDNLFSFVAALKAKRVGYEQSSFYHRRVRKNSLVTMDKTAVHFYGYFLCYLEMSRFCQGINIDTVECEAASKMIEGVYNNAVNIYCLLKKEDRLSLRSPKSTADTLSSFNILVSRAKGILKLNESVKKLEESELKLKQLRSSRLYKILLFLRNIVLLKK